ncbi:MAG: FAD-binding protein, partial [Deltaproteobacteria bacterium]|nr:FAD-binding protein [Deltaproteobacteria bacterium]
MKKIDFTLCAMRIFIMSEFCPPIKKFKGKLQCSVSLAEYTSFRVGGRVDYLAFPVDEEDLRSILALCAAQGVPYFILGNGTNLLVKDGGVQGVAVSLAQGFGRIAEISREEEGGLLLAESGVALWKLVE